MKAIAILIAFLVTFGALAVVPAGKWSVVIVAGSAEQHVFDNAAKHFQKKLETEEIGSKRFTSNLEEAGIKNGVHTPFATLAGIEESMTREDGPCLVYITSHGSRNGTTELGRQELTPSILSDMMTKSCGKKPGILIVSACFSGVYTKIRAEHPNWTVFTASSEDRSSFGCTNDLTYTYWDGCFLKGLDAGITDLKMLYIATTRCVRKLEVDMELLPQQYSMPLFYQGKDSPTKMPW